MKDHPILFSGEMVRAILDGRKTQTRRVIKPQPCVDYKDGGVPWHYSRTGCDYVEIRCPYGKPGDRLWVRETFCYGKVDCGDYEAPADPPIYVSQCKDENDVLPQEAMIREGICIDEVVWKPSIHMPRSASRILLEVTDVRVERVQEIPASDCAKEGLIWEDVEQGSDHLPASQCWVAGFKSLWDSINAKRGKTKKYKKLEWGYWLWGNNESDDPEAISLDIPKPERIRWRDPDDIDDSRWHYFEDSAPPCNGQYDVMWTSDDKPISVYLQRYEGKEGINYESVGGFGWDKNPWVWVVEFKRIEAK